LGLYEKAGTRARANNIVLADAAPFSHNFCPMLDTRPGVPPAQRYKALAGVQDGGGLAPFVSSDGLRWRKQAEKPAIVRGRFAYAFDSQNVPFWSEAEQRYVCYFRVSTPTRPAPTSARRISMSPLRRGFFRAGRCFRPSRPRPSTSIRATFAIAPTASS
jgi:hypothetical protein